MNRTQRHVLAAWVALLVGATHLACARPPKASSLVQPTPATSSSATDPNTSNSDSSPTPTPSEHWAAFTSAWNTGDAAQLASYEPSQDLLVLDNPGAFVRMKYFSSLAQFFAQAGEYDSARVPKLRLLSQLKSGTAPVANCETAVALTGNYLSAPARAQLIQRVQALTDYELAPAEEVARLKVLVQVIEAGAMFAVYDLDQSVGFLFAHHPKGISLVAVDAVVPCSA